MTFDQKKIAQEQIWSYVDLENQINNQLHLAIADCRTVSYRAVDSLFLETPKAWTQSKLVVTDNIPIRNVIGDFLPLFPEYWHIYFYQPVYQNRPATSGFNCFMNRVSADRALAFQYLKSNNLLSSGLISFNCLRPGNSDVIHQDQLDYGSPFNNIKHSLEQSIIDSNISLVMETYISDDHITFSEKIFRALQLPRPWLLYCSPLSVLHLKKFGFDVLDDYVDHTYDHEPQHYTRLFCILHQLRLFVDKKYTDKDYARFEQAAENNRNLLKQFEQSWPIKLKNVLDNIKKYD
jgi:hypothetical protein